MLTRITNQQITDAGDKAASGKFGGATGGFGDTLDVIRVNGTVKLQRLNVPTGLYTDIPALTIPGAPTEKAASSVSYTSQGDLLLALADFGEQQSTKLYKVDVSASTQTLLATLNFAVTSFTVLSLAASTERATNEEDRYAVITLVGSASLFLLDLTNYTTQPLPYGVAADVVDTEYYDNVLYYITKAGSLYALDMRTGFTSQPATEVLNEPQSVFYRVGSIFVNTSMGSYELDLAGTHLRRPNTFFANVKVRPAIQFGERADITFRSDEEFSEILPAVDYFEQVRYDLLDLPTGLHFNAETRELSKTAHIQPGVYQLQYKATGPTVTLTDGTVLPGITATQRFSITVGAPAAEGGLCIAGENPVCTFARNSGVHICSLINSGRQSVTPAGQLPAGVTLRQPQASTTVRRATPILNETGLQAQGFDLTQALTVNDLQLHLISYSDVVDVNTFVPTLQYRLFGCENEPPVSRLYYKREIATGPLARGHNPCGPGFAGNQVNNPNWTGWRILQMAYIDPDTETARVFEYNTSTETLVELLGDSTFYTQQQFTTRVTPAQLRIDTAVLSVGNHAISAMQDSNTLTADVKIVNTAAEIDACRKLQLQPTAAQQVPLSILEEGGLLLNPVNLRATTDDQQFNIALPRATKND